jgi:maleate cis-trans isomerase
MAFSTWRGTVGLVKPEVSAGQYEEFVRLLPDGIGAIQLFMDLPKERGPARFEAALKQLDQKIGELAEAGCDVVVTEGSAVFMRDGVKAEAKLVRGWEKKHKVQVAPTGQTIVNAMKAMGFKKVIGVRPATWKTGADFTGRYFQGAGFDVLTIASPAGHDHTSVLEITPREVYQTVKQAFLAHPGADGIFIMAAIMSSLDMLQTLEDDLGVPVVSAVTARIWEVQRRLHVRQPVKGYGSLLAEMP